MKSINNIFEMVKADRYTADGREEIIKAQEAETQDARRYKTGEISEATGLQKQPDGSWAPPKKGAQVGAKQGAGIPKADEKTFVGKTYKDFAESARASGYTPKAEKENPDGSSSTTFENKEGKAIRVDFDKNGKISKVDAGVPEGEKQENIVSKTPKMNSEYDWEHGRYDEEIDVSKEPLMVKVSEIKNLNKTGRLGAIRTTENSYFNNKHGTFEVVRFDDDNVYIHRKAPGRSDKIERVKIPLTSIVKITPWHDYGVRNPETGEVTPTRPVSALRDSAPLTGDTRIRMNQVTDKVYQIGEISQKTGLQKTANGWVKPKKGAPAGTKKEAGTIHKKAAISKTTSEQLNQSDNLKEGKWVNFETTNGNRFTGKVTMIGKNLIKFRDAEGKEMGFNKKNITRVEPKTEESQNAPGPVGIPSNKALLSHLV